MAIYIDHTGKTRDAALAYAKLSTVLFNSIALNTGNQEVINETSGELCEQALRRPIACIAKTSKKAMWLGPVLRFKGLNTLNAKCSIVNQCQVPMINTHNAHSRQLTGQRRESRGEDTILWHDYMVSSTPSHERNELTKSSYAIEPDVRKLRRKHSCYTKAMNDKYT